MIAMKLTSGQRLILDRMINVFETGTIKGKYGAISIYRDGPHLIRQITYGRSQTTEYGNLRQLVEMYANAGGTYSDDLKSYVPLIGNTALVDNEPFKQLLRRAGNEDPVMRATQDKFFDQVYFQPAEKWADANGFTRPLSMLVIYDSFIHSGGILPFLRARFAELPPARGGDEKRWISQYAETRHKWLSTHSRADLRASSYRTKDLVREIGRGNWDLSNLPLMANGTPVDDGGGGSKVAVPAIPKIAVDEPVPFLGDLEEAATGPAEDLDGFEEALDSPAAFAPEAAQDRATTLRALGASVGVSGATERLIAYRDKYRPTSNPRYWAVVNFGLHSAKPRLFLSTAWLGPSRSICAPMGGARKARPTTAMPRSSRTRTAPIARRLESTIAT